MARTSVPSQLMPHEAAAAPPPKFGSAMLPNPSRAGVVKVDLASEHDSEDDAYSYYDSESDGVEAAPPAGATRAGIPAPRTPPTLARPRPLKDEQRCKLTKWSSRNRPASPLR